MGGETGKREGRGNCGWDIKTKKLNMKEKKKPDVVAGTCNPSAEKVETAGSLGS